MREFIAWRGYALPETIGSAQALHILHKQSSTDPFDLEAVQPSCAQRTEVVDV